jgi:histone deacetylase 11
MQTCKKIVVILLVPLVTLMPVVAGWSIYPTNSRFGEGKVPIVYDNSYNIKCFGLEKLHPFDTTRPGKIFKELFAQRLLTHHNYFVPGEISEDDLKKVHTAEYIAALHNSSEIAEIAEFPLLAAVPNAWLQKWLLKPMRYATAGTVLAAQLALKYGWSINLSGGYHHAKDDGGEGFCVYADIPLFMRKTH